MSNKIIYTTAEGDLHVVHPTDAVTDLAAHAAEVVPSGVTYEIVAESVIPTDRLFRGAWTESTPGAITEDLTKSKVIAHEIRRSERATEFAPHDEVISLHIPGSALTDAETARTTIREKYATIQSDIDSATSVAELRTVLATI